MSNYEQRLKIMSQLISARREKGLSQEKVALAMGSHKSHICRMEKGNQNPSLDMLMRYAEALGMELEVNLKDRPAPEKAKTNANPIIRAERQNQAFEYALAEIRKSDIAPFIDEMYLYGSCARGDEKSSSDVDIFIQLSEEFKSHPELKGSMMLLKGEASSPELFKPEADLKFVVGNDWKTDKTPYYKNVKKEGIRIWL